MAELFSRTVGNPNVLAHGDSQCHPILCETHGRFPFVEIAFFVEHAIVGKNRFAAMPQQLAVGNQGGGIVELVTRLLDGPDNGGDAFRVGNDAL